jgi:endonuclease YncB( thermonuclease family)
MTDLTTTDVVPGRDGQHVLEITGLRAGVAGKEILRGIDLTVRSGEVHAVMGPNGSGKSTLAHVLMGRPGYEVIDGSVRLDGVDCPELGQAFGRRAKEPMAALVFGKEVKVAPTAIDQYGRTVARVHVGGIDLSLELVQAGLAWHFTKYNTDPALAAAEGQARRATRGLWVDERSPAAAAQGLLSPDAAAPPTDAPFHGNTRSKVFHAASCPQFDCPNCTEPFAMREAAIAAGYSPCGFCSP